MLFSAAPPVTTTPISPENPIDNPTIKKKKRPNLQWTRLPSGKRVKACTKCIKALGKKK